MDNSTNALEAEVHVYRNGNYQLNRIFHFGVLAMRRATPWTVSRAVPISGGWRIDEGSLQDFDLCAMLALSRVAHAGVLINFSDGNGLVTTFNGSLTVGTPTFNAGNCLPFNCNVAGQVANVDYQQAHSSGAFGGPTSISSLTFDNWVWGGTLWLSVVRIRYTSPPRPQHSTFSAPICPQTVAATGPGWAGLPPALTPIPPSQFPVAPSLTFPATEICW